MTGRLIKFVACLLAAWMIPAFGSSNAETASQYTSIAPQDCRQVLSDEESASVAFSCPGVAGMDVWIGEGDLRTFFGFGATPRKQCSASQTFGAFNTAGGKMEWRLQDGKVIAAIVRYRLDDGAGNRQSFLAVIALNSNQACHMAYVDGAVKDHNALARTIADTQAGDFDCARDVPILVTKRDIQLNQLVSGIPCGPEAAMGFKP